ncbi:hypothetical protein ACPCAJ_21290 [Streptomyces griseoincarnatus]
MTQTMLHGALAGGRRPDWIRVPMAAPTVWMATADGLVSLDLIAVERAANGERQGWTLTGDEARYAAQVMFQRGLSYSVIATRVGLSGSTIRDWFPEQTVTLDPRLARPRPSKPKPKRKPKPVVRCGTMQGYRRHHRRQDPPCDPCREAKRLADRYYAAHGTYVGAPEVAV